MAFRAYQQKGSQETLNYILQNIKWPKIKFGTDRLYRSVPSHPMGQMFRPIPYHPMGRKCCPILSLPIPWTSLVIPGDGKGWQNLLVGWAGWDNNINKAVVWEGRERQNLLVGQLQKFVGWDGTRNRSHGMGRKKLSHGQACLFS